MPPDPLLAGSLVALGSPSAAAFAAWLSVGWALRRRCLDGGALAADGSLGLGSSPASVLEPLVAEADRLAAEASFSRGERWKRMQAAIDGAAASDAGAGLKSAIESCLHEAATSFVIRERDDLMLHRLLRLQGPLAVAVMGSAHAAGMERAASAAARPVDEAALLAKPRLPLWRVLAGRPLLWRMRGSRLVSGSTAER